MCQNYNVNKNERCELWFGDEGFYVVPICPTRINKDIFFGRFNCPHEAAAWAKNKRWEELIQL